VLLDLAHNSNKHIIALNQFNRELAKTNDQ